MATRILIVEDDIPLRDAVHEYMQLAGYDVYVATSAEEALDILAETSVDIVIADILLPGMDGLKLTDIIKRDWDIDVIVITGYASDYSYAEAISMGASDFIFKPLRLEELNLRLKRVIKERKINQERLQMMDELKKLSITDGLTQLYNSRYFYSQLKSEIERFNRYGHQLSLLLLDIDNFKIYNDTYGHLNGDKILVRIGQIIKACLRKMDTAYRYGGEEFTIILPGTAGTEAKNVAERLRLAVAVDDFDGLAPSETGITISVGVAHYCLDEQITSFVQRADQALYQSKQTGRNKVTYLLADGGNP